MSSNAITKSNSSTPRPLFREQAVNNLIAKQYGTVILSSSLSQRFLTFIFVTIASCIIIFFVSFSTTRKIQASGVLMPNSGIIRVASTQNGIIVEKRVREGQLVKVGEVLYVLRSERQSYDIKGVSEHSSKTIDTQKTISSIIQKRQNSFKAELTQSDNQGKQRALSLQQRLYDIAQEIQQIDAQIILQQKRVSLSEQKLKRLKELHATNYISSVQLQDSESELIDQQQRLMSSLRDKASNQREYRRTDAELKDAKISSMREQVALQRNFNGAEQDLLENENRREFVITASQSGVMAAMMGEQGQAVVLNQVLASILPENSTLEAEIYASSNAIGFLKPGMQVLLRYQAFPYQKFGQHVATVREIANTSLRPDELALPTAASSSTGVPVYRIRLTLAKQDVIAYGESMPLRSGMQVDASILLEKRRLYEWILEPIFSISGRI